MKQKNETTKCNKKIKQKMKGQNETKNNVMKKKD